MTVQEYLDGRAAYGKGSRDPKVAREARNDYRAKLKDQRKDELMDHGHSERDAERLAEAETDHVMSTLHALHNPDLVVGGKDAIADFGDGEVNSTIGRQWNRRGKDFQARTQNLDQAALEIPQTERARTKMNSKLERCK